MLTFENQLATPAVGISLTDNLPVGLCYVPDSATFDGADTPEPVVAGCVVSWTGITIPAGNSVTTTLDARIAAGFGSLINRAIAVDQNGNPVSNEATAEIVLPPKALFDCGDVIGKVFDNRNMNGYQDGPNGEDLGACRIRPMRAVNTMWRPRLSRAASRVCPMYAWPQSTARSSTDEYGRYQVLCAELPARIGSNFTLKLDERSLPTGYRVTTENRRVVRLNFGAAIANVVDFDLTGGALPMPMCRSRLTG